MYISEISYSDKKEKLYKCIPNVIVGSNGSGKTSLLKCIVSNRSNVCNIENFTHNGKNCKIVSNLILERISKDVINYNLFSLWDTIIHDLFIDDNKVVELNDFLRVTNHKVGDIYNSYGIFLYLANRLMYGRFERCVSIIDEIESSISLSNSKNILTVLKTLFPNDQFIVATHSPFIFSEDNIHVFEV